MGTKKHWVCLACGYIYENGDPPDKCPICGAPKRAFYSRHEMPDPAPLKPAKEFKVKTAPEKGKEHWVCLACGYIYEDGDPPDKCPICGAPKRAFMPRQHQ